MRAFTTEVTRVAIAAALMTLTPVVGVEFGPLAAGAAQAETVSSIIVRGNQRMDPETVTSYLTIKAGKPYSAKDIDDSLKALYATELFGDVKIERQGGALVVTVTESPLLNKVAFEGNKRLTDEQLGTVIESKARGFLSKSRVQSDVQHLLEVYRRQGRFRASVEPKIIELPQGRVNLVFEVDEGDKTAVQRISFVGNHAYSEGRLRDIIKTRETGLLGFIRTTDTYDSDRLEKDQDNLRKFYLRNGYADVKIVAANADLDRERNEFIVTFTIDEGDQYKVGSVDVESSIAQLDPAALKGAVHSHSGDVYSSEDVDKSIEDITAVASRAGLPFTEVRPRAARDYASKTINVTYYVEEGTHVYVDRINVRGNTRTRDYVIRREFDVLEGDAYNKALISKAERRLNRLGFFKNVKVTTEQVAPDRVAINVEVEEQSTGEISFGAGYSTTDGVIGDVSISERNFMGRGQFAKAGFQIGKYTKGVSLSFTEPYFLDRRVSAGIELYAQRLAQTYYRPYQQDMYGGAIRFGVPITEDFTVGPTYSLYYRKITLSGTQVDGNWDNGEAALSYKLFVDPGFNGGQQTTLPCASAGKCSRSVITSMPGFALVYNTVDNIQMPHSGIYAKLQNDVAGLGGDSSFLRNTLDVRYYHDVYADWGLIGALKLKAGNIVGLGKKVDIIDNFFIGGETIRGFADSGLGPRDLSKVTSISSGSVFSANEALGARTYIAGTAEVSAPVPGTPEEFGLYYSLFADAGTVFNLDKSALPAGYVKTKNCPASGVVGCYVDDAAIRSSVGFGILWKSPFGPIRGDFGFALTKAQGDVTQIFRFSGGTQF
ncbi:MAG: outer membrane protein assembly factor BamA [Ancalomicrobiaceae bacterium]|nr:outer membrane protein assembly factor BamA [Ancalomicrobiaceae bacterium]